MSATTRRPESSRLAIVTLALGLGVAGCASSAPATPSAPSSTTPVGSVEAPASSAPPVATPSSSASPSALASPAASPAVSAAFDPANFPDGATVTNPWFPLIPGTVFTSTGTKDGKHAIDIVTVTDRTKVIAGVTTRVIDDRTTLDGVLAERTTDYYAQDKAGNVWYLGEDTAELDSRGNVLNREGTWHTGVGGAVPGIYMEADPIVGHAYQQEFYPGHAEDHYEVISLTASVHVPYGAFTNAQRTKEWTPLEPDVLDNKFYVLGIGQVREVAVKGPKETFSLVSIKKP
jgi:hypothetical protein